MGGLGGFLTCLGHFLIRPCGPRVDRKVRARLPIQPSRSAAAFEAPGVSEEVESEPEAWAPAKEPKCGLLRAPPGLHTTVGARFRGEERVSFQGPRGTWRCEPRFSRGHEQLIS